MLLKSLCRSAFGRTTKTLGRPPLTVEELESRLVPSTFTFRQGENGYAGAVSGAISSLGGGNGTTFRDGIVDWCVGVLPSDGYSESPLLRFENLGIAPGSVVTSATLTIKVVSWKDGQRMVGHYLNVPWDNNTSADPEANSTDPNKLGWLLRAPGTPWASPGATGDGADVIAGRSFALPQQGTFSSTGDTVVTANLDPAVVQGWIDNPASNYGVILTVDLPDHHMGYVQPQQHTTGSDSRPLGDRPLLTITVSSGGTTGGGSGGSTGGSSGGSTGGSTGGSAGGTPSARPALFATGADAGGGPNVLVFDALTGQVKYNFFAYDPHFTGGVRVAVGDVNWDRYPDVITVAGPGGGPDVKVISGKDGSVLLGFFAYDMRFTGGVRVAAGDVNGDGRADIICGSGAGGGPNVTVFSGATGAILASYFAYDPALTSGLYVAAGDVNGDGKADVVTGTGPGSAPDVRVFSGADNSEVARFFAYDPAFRGGVRVGAVDRTGDGKADVLCVAGPGGGSDTRTVDATTRQQIDDFFAYDMNFRSGLFVAGGR